MNDSSPPTKMDTLNQGVRAIVTLGLLLGFIALAWTKEIDSGLYTNVFSIVIAFWFAQRTPSSKNGNGGTNGNGTATTVTTPAPTTVTLEPKP